MANCAKCGAPVSGNFCGVCGAKIEVGAAPASSPASSPTGTPRSRFKATVVVAPASPPRAPLEDIGTALVRAAEEHASGLRRPEAERDFVFRVEPEIDAGALVSPGDEDVFVGEVEGAIAFLLLGTSRPVPEACRGAFVARTPRLFDVDAEVGVVADEQQREARLAVRGSLLVQVIDAIRFLQADVPRTTADVASMILDACVPELRGRIEAAIEQGELAIAELGDAGDAVKAILGEIVGALDLPREYGLVAWFEDVSLAADVDDGAVARAGDDKALVEAHDRALEAGAWVTVGAGETFVGVIDGRPATSLEAGRHRLDRALDRGWFVRRVPTRERFDGSLGTLDDATRTRAEVHASGDARVAVVDPAAFVGALAEHHDGAREAVSSRLLAAVGRRLSSALAGGSLRLASLEGASDVLRARPLEAGDLPGADVELDEIEIAAAIEASEPAPISVGAKVLVAWPDGNRYPATVQQAQQGHFYVVFPNGQQGWVTADRITRA